MPTWLRDLLWALRLARQRHVLMETLSAVQEARTAHHYADDPDLHKTGVSPETLRGDADIELTVAESNLCQVLGYDWVDVDHHTRARKAD
jgi:hypothetical protein